VRKNGETFPAEIDSVILPGEPGRSFVILRDISRRKMTEETLRANAARQNFLLRLSDAVRPVDDPAKIQELSTRLLGEHLELNRCTCGELRGEEAVVLAQAFRDGLPRSVSNTETDPSVSEKEREGLRAVGIAAFAGVVLKRHGRAVASFGVHSSTPRNWTADELALISEAGERTWQAVERAQAQQALRRSEERYQALALENGRLYRQQLEIAEDLQNTLLHVPSQIGPVRLGHLYRSATEAARVGGDFYDAFNVKDGQVAVLIGDVAGHGIQAARTATLVKDVVHAFTHQSLRTHEVMRQTNKLLVEKDLPGFVSLFLAILATDTGHLRYSSAGHPYTLLRRAAGDVELLGCASSPLGVFPEARWRPHETEMSAGDLLLLYTDGVTEARSGDEFFGEERLGRLVKRQQASPDKLPGQILDRVLEFSGATLRDDLAIMALSFTESGLHSNGHKRFKQERLLQ
jgi:serine phosphatase RsbU (regulator of sigma subunit)